MFFNYLRFKVFFFKRETEKPARIADFKTLGTGQVNYKWFIKKVWKRWPIWGLYRNFHDQKLNPTVAVTFKFQQELAFVASLGDVPDLIWKVMPFCSCHRSILYRKFWCWKSQYRAYFGLFLKQFRYNFKWLAWPVPVFPLVMRGISNVFQHLTYSSNRSLRREVLFDNFFRICISI
jgi:hypothetical protein